MILAGSLEFEKGHNNEVQERPSDNVELPEVINKLMTVLVVKSPVIYPNKDHVLSNILSLIEEG